MKIIPFAFFLLSVQTVYGQNLGIGTTNPSRAKIEVIGVAGGGKTSTLFGSDIAGISLQRDFPSIGFNQYRNIGTGNGIYQSTGYASLLYLDANAGSFNLDMLGTGTGGTTTQAPTRALTITSIGVGIRNTSPQASIHVNRGNGFEGTAVFAGPAHWSHFNYATAEDTYIRGGTNVGNSVLYINKIPNGNVAIGSGTTKVSIGKAGYAPAGTLEITGGAWHYLRLQNGYAHYWSQVPNIGNLDLYYNNGFKGRFRNTDGNYIVGSDERLKTSITNLEPMLEKLKQLKPVVYQMKNNNPNKEESIGLIAQDVQTLFPMLVKKETNHNWGNVKTDKLLSINYSGLFVVGIKALQEQYQQIKDLQKEQDALLQKLLELKEKIIAEK